MGVIGPVSRVLPYRCEGPPGRWPCCLVGELSSSFVVAVSVVVADGAVFDLDDDVVFLVADGCVAEGAVDGVGHGVKIWGVMRSVFSAAWSASSFSTQVMHQLLWGYRSLGLVGSPQALHSITTCGVGCPVGDSWGVCCRCGGAAATSRLLPWLRALPACVVDWRFGMDVWNQWPKDGSLPAVVEEYVEWLVSMERQPSTKRAWAAEHGVSVSSLTNWDRDDRVRRAVDARCSELNMSPERIQSVIDAVFRSAQQGDMKAAQLYLQHVDRLAPKRTIIEDRRVSSLSDEELRAELAGLGLLDN